MSETNEEKILLGMMRPSWPPCNVTGYVYCVCGHILQTVDSCYAHWQMGHFDEPVYCTKEEMMDRMIAQNKNADFHGKGLVMNEEIVGNQKLVNDSINVMKDVNELKKEEIGE